MSDYHIPTNAGVPSEQGESWQEVADRLNDVHIDALVAEVFSNE